MGWFAPGRGCMWHTITLAHSGSELGLRSFDYNIKYWWASGEYCHSTFYCISLSHSFHRHLSIYQYLSIKRAVDLSINQYLYRPISVSQSVSLSVDQSPLWGRLARAIVTIVLRTINQLCQHSHPYFSLYILILAPTSNKALWYINIYICFLYILYRSVLIALHTH